MPRKSATSFCVFPPRLCRTAPTIDVPALTMPQCRREVGRRLPLPTVYTPHRIGPYTSGGAPSHPADIEGYQTTPGTAMFRLSTSEFHFQYSASRQASGMTVYLRHRPNRNQILNSDPVFRICARYTTKRRLCSISNPRTAGSRFQFPAETLLPRYSTAEFRSRQYRKSL